MSDHLDNTNKLEEAIKAELAAKKPIGSGDLLSLALNNLRSNQNIRFNNKYASPGRTQGDPTEDNLKLLNEYEKFVFNRFLLCKSQMDVLNKAYSNQYRGSYILNYNVAIVAVSLAVTLLGLEYFSQLLKFSTNQLFLAALLVLGIAKALCLAAILVNTIQANNTEFNQRAITYRYIAEQFRLMLYLPLLGIRSLPTPSVSRFVTAKWQNNFIQKYIRGELKQAFAETDKKAFQQHVQLDFNTRLAPLLAFIQADLVNGQLQYHEGVAEKQQRIHERLHKRAGTFNIIVLATVSLEVLILTLKHLGLISELIFKPFDEYLSPLILVLATIIPALVASFNGIRFQTEAKKLSERSRFMSVMFTELNGKYSALINKVTNAQNNPNNPGSYTCEAIDLLTETAQVMVDEVTEWTFIYTKEITE